MKQFIFTIGTILILKGLVFFGIFDENDLNSPLKIKLDVTGINFDTSDEEKTYYEIVEGKARVGNVLFNNNDLVQINGKTYLVDMGLEKAQLFEYTVFKRLVRNFELLNSERKFAWLYYIRILSVIIAIMIFMIPDVGIGYGVFLMLVQLFLLTLPTFLIVGYLGWTGWYGFSVLVIIFLVDFILGAISGSE